MMEELIKLATANDVNLVNAIIRLILSMLLGSLIGWERMSKGQTAGMRTFSLISTGATLAMLVSIFIPQEYMGLKNGDPGRIAAQVVSGIGFLGAGAIIQMKGSVRGLTTAAGIWVTAMMGLAVGAGMYVIPILATLIIIFILVVMNKSEHLLHLGDEAKIVRVKLHGIMTDVSPLKQMFLDSHIHVSDVYIKYEYDQDITILNYLVRCKNDMDFVPLFERISSAYKTVSITLSNEVNV